MEIMVVIIVIAVLASVAGPMIGSITDQGRASATKSKISALKSAMLAYQSDTGRLPFSGIPNNAGKIAAYCSNLVLTDSADSNVLVSDCNAQIQGITNYNRKWKGPYMDSDPTDFMYDSWGNKLNYIAQGNNIYLQSSGPDAVMDTVNNALNAVAQAAGDTDDIILSIARTKKPLN